MGDLVELLFLLIAAIMVVAFTVSLVIDLVKRKPVFSSLKKWFVGVIDALSGV
jgi:hypothetical protein